MRWKKREGYHYQHVILNNRLELKKKTHVSDICEKKKKKKKKEKKKRKKFSFYFGDNDYNGRQKTLKHIKKHTRCT